MRHATVVLSCLTLLLVSGTASADTLAPDGPQPLMKAAIVHLQQAKSQLTKAAPNKGGHRVKAIALVNQALKQVKKGIAFANKHEGEGDAPTFGTAAQPHMNAALTALQAARNKLKKATPNKGGHRVKAIALVQQAIAQVKKGIAYANKH